MTTLLFVHFLLCIALGVTAMRRHRTHPGDPASYRRILPLVLVTALVAVPLLVMLLQTWGVFFRFWPSPVDARTKAVFVEVSVAALCPALSLPALIPWVGRRPAAVAILALFAGLPPAAVYVLLFAIVGGAV